MIQEMQDADLFLQPSVTAADGDSEGGAPTTLLEAQACGLPVLATQHADIPYVVSEGESALLAPERDVDALFKNLLVLLDEPERWAAMGSAGRVRVEHLHDALVEVPRLEQLYLELAKEAPCSPS
jgi:colanic acid/amylovoran biosynthesis glycosyltransferase